MKRKTFVKTLSAAALLLFAFAAAAACGGGKNGVTFYAAASYSAETGTVFTVPAITAELDGRREPAAVSVADAAGQPVDVYGSAFFVADTTDYTVTFTAFGESTTRTVYVSPNNRPEIWQQCAPVIPAQTGREYIFDMSKIVTTDGCERQYAVLDAESEPIESRTDENGNLRFVPSPGDNTVQIIATKAGRQAETAVTVRGVDRSDNVIADFETDGDMEAVKVGPSGYTITMERSTAVSHTGSGSLRLTNLAASPYPRVALAPLGNITVDPDASYTLNVWYRFDNPDRLPVGLAVMGIGANRDILPTGAPATYDGQWHKFSTACTGAQLFNVAFYMFNWQGNTGIAPDPGIALYLDDIYLEPQIDGESVYYAAREAGGTFDASAIVAPLLLGGHEVPVTGYRVTKTLGGTETEVTLTDGKVPLDETAVWRLYPENVTGDAAYIVRVVESLDPGAVPYAPLDIPEDAQQFDLGSGFEYNTASGGCLSNQWDNYVDTFTLTFRSDTSFDLSAGGRVRFDFLPSSITDSGFTLTIRATLADGTELPVMADGAEFADLSITNSPLRQCWFDIPAGGMLKGAGLTFSMCLNGQPTVYANCRINNFFVTAIPD